MIQRLARLALHESNDPFFFLITPTLPGLNCSHRFSFLTSHFPSRSRAACLSSHRSCFILTLEGARHLPRSELCNLLHCIGRCTEYSMTRYRSTDGATPTDQHAQGGFPGHSTSTGSTVAQLSRVVRRRQRRSQVAGYRLHQACHEPSLS